MPRRPWRARVLVAPVAVALLVLGGCGDETGGNGAGETTGGSTGGSTDTGDPGDASDDTDGPTDTGDRDDASDDTGGSDDTDTDDTDGPTGTDESDESPDPDDADGQPSDAECVGEDSGALSVTGDRPTKLPGGSDAILESTDFDADPPKASIELGDATQIERDNASDLAVGDQFGFQRGVYKVIGLCPDSVTLEEF